MVHGASSPTAWGRIGGDDRRVRDAVLEPMLVTVASLQSFRMHRTPVRAGAEKARSAVAIHWRQSKFPSAGGLSGELEEAEAVGMGCHPGTRRTGNGFQQYAAAGERLAGEILHHGTANRGGVKGADEQRRQ